MKITLTHPEEEIRELIMDWLYVHSEVSGNEEYLLGERLSDLLGSSEIISLEIYLSKWFNDNITLPKDLIFIKQ